MVRTKEEIEFELALEKDRYRWAMENVSKHDKRIEELKRELEDTN